MRCGGIALCSAFKACAVLLATQSLGYLRQWNITRRESGFMVVHAVAFGITMLCFEPLGITTQEVQARTATKEGMEETVIRRATRAFCSLCCYHEGDSSIANGSIIPAVFDTTPVIWAQDLERSKTKLMQYYARAIILAFEPSAPMRFNLLAKKKKLTLLSQNFRRSARLRERYCTVVWARPG